MHSVFKSFLFAIVFAFSAAASFAANNIASVRVPAIESWELDTSIQTDNYAAEEGGHYIKWYKDPTQDGYQGMLVYWKASKNASPVLIGKAWGWRTTAAGEMDIGQMRSALLLDTGWFVGDEGESVRIVYKFENQSDGSRREVGTTFRFKGNNSDTEYTFLYQ